MESWSPVVLTLTTCKLTQLWYTHLPKHLKGLQISPPDTCRGATYDIEGLDILCTNIDQFNKCDDLNLAIAGSEPDITLITEILLKALYNTLTSARLSLNGYSSVFNFDPDETSSLSNRGVGIYISEKFAFCEVQFDSNCVENVWIKIALRGQDSLLVGCIYHSPSSNPHQSTSDL